MSNLFYKDASILPEEDGKYSLIQRVGSMSPKLQESVVFFRRGHWPRLDWHSPIAWRQLAKTELERYKGSS